MVPCPEIMITSGELSSSRIFCNVSRPSMPGSQTSSSTTSNAWLASRRIHCSPVSAASVRKPSSSSTPRRESRMPDSSSTMRMLDMFHGNRRGLRRERQFHDEARSYRLVLLDPDRSTMVLNDSAHNRQTQPGATLLGREVRQKEFFLQFLGDAVPRVGHQNLYRIAAGHQGRADLDLSRQRVGHRL